MSLLNYNKNKISYILVVTCFFVCAQTLYSQSSNKNPKKDLENKGINNDNVKNFLGLAISNINKDINRKYNEFDSKIVY